MALSFLVRPITGWHCTNYDLYAKDSRFKRELTLEFCVCQDNVPIDPSTIGCKVLHYLIFGASKLPTPRASCMNIRRCTFKNNTFTVVFHPESVSTHDKETTFRVQLLLRDEAGFVVAAHHTHPFVVVTKRLPREIDNEDKMLSKWNLTRHSAPVPEQTMPLSDRLFVLPGGGHFASRGDELQQGGFLASKTTPMLEHSAVWKSLAGKVPELKLNREVPFPMIEEKKMI